MNFVYEIYIRKKQQAVQDIGFAKHDILSWNTGVMLLLNFALAFWKIILPTFYGRFGSQYF